MLPCEGFGVRLTLPMRRPESTHGPYRHSHGELARVNGPNVLRLVHGWLRGNHLLRWQQVVHRLLIGIHSHSFINFIAESHRYASPGPFAHSSTVCCECG